MGLTAAFFTGLAALAAWFSAIQSSKSSIALEKTRKDEFLPIIQPAGPNYEEHTLLPEYIEGKGKEGGMRITFANIGKGIAMQPVLRWGNFDLALSSDIAAKQQPSIDIPNAREKGKLKINIERSRKIFSILLKATKNNYKTIKFSFHYSDVYNRNCKSEFTLKATRDDKGSLHIDIDQWRFIQPK